MLPGIVECELAGQIWQLIDDSDPRTVENVPLTHGKQSELPVVTLYVPALHAVQFPAPVPVKPGGH